jgi:hypothetical protein
MAFVKVRVPRTSQPQELVGIDWDNPLTKTLIFVQVGDKLIDLLGSRNASSASRESVGILGKSTKYSGVKAVWTNPVNASDWLGDLSVGAVLAPDSLPADMAVIGYGNSNSGTHTPIEFGTYSTTGALKFGRANSASYKVWASPSSVMAVGRVDAVVGTQAGGIQNAPNFYTSKGATGAATAIYSGTGTGAASNSGATFNTGGRDDTSSLFYGSAYLQVAWKNELSPDSAMSWAKNPWQIFEPEERLIWIPDAVSVTLPTIGRPLSTITPGAWTATGGTGGLPGAINETVHSAAEYISVASASMCELALDTTAYPGGATQVLSYWASSTAGSTLTVRLRQSGATVASWTHPLTTSDTLYQQTLTAPQIAALTSGAMSVQLETS